MKEDFLHYVWQFQKFSSFPLYTVLGEEVEVFYPGSRNNHAGPDFLEGRVKIARLIWYGNIEIHINASDWYKHAHHKDPIYDNVILHVVWNNDCIVYRQDGSEIPAIELKDIVHENLVQSYHRFLNNRSSIPCERFYDQVPEIKKRQMWERVLIERMKSKATQIKTILKSNKYDWETTTYQWVFRSFGFKLNQEPFLQLSKCLPLKDVLKHRLNLFQVEALLFGRAGFLNQEGRDTYTSELKKEYVFLKKKFSWVYEDLKRSQWKFLRTRPANFPTVRLAQLASVLHNYTSLFQYFINYRDPGEVQNVFRHPVSDYWLKHYDLGKPWNKATKCIGDQSIYNLVINTVAPLLTVYGEVKQENSYIERAMDLLESIPAEYNYIIKRWQSLEPWLDNAFESQALIHLYKFYCLKRQCLRCSIGFHTLNTLSCHT